MTKIFVSILTFAFFRCVSQNGICFSSAPYSPFDNISYYSDTADFNSDGVIDLVSLNGNGIKLCNSIGQNGFNPAVSFTSGSQPYFIRAGDFNNDGNIDAVAVNPPDSGNVILFFGNGAGSFTNQVRHTVGANPSPLLVSDFNNDGNKDFAILQNSLTIHLGNGQGTFSVANTYSILGSNVNFISTDFNNDNNADIAINYGSQVSIYRGYGNGSFTLTSVLNYSFSAQYFWYNFISKDIDNNGFKDLIGATWNGTVMSVSIARSNGNFLFQPLQSYSLTGNAIAGISTGDFNYDGQTDIVTANYSSSNISILLNSGSGTFPTVVNYSVTSNWPTPGSNCLPWHIWSAKLDNNNKDDILIGLDNNYEVIALLNCNVTSILDLKAENKYFRVYPSPANDYFEIKSDFDKSSIRSISLFSSNGSLVYFVDISEINILEKFFLPDLPSGLYSLNCETLKEGTISTRLIVSD
jgi:hypothetical protein